MLHCSHDEKNLVLNSYNRFITVTQHLLAGPLRENFSGGTKVDASPQISSGTKVAQNFLSSIIKLSPIFFPKLGEEQEKKGLH